MRVAIRVDATSRMGTGHLMRCLALAEACEDAGGDAVFITHCEAEGLLEKIRKEEFRICPLREKDSLEITEAAIKELKPDWVVLDGYQFGQEYQKAVKGLGRRLLVIDDYAHLDHYHADIVLNQNYGAEMFRYNAEPYTRFLLGTEYVLLRREFLRFKDFDREIPNVANKLLVTLGGSDPDNNALKVLRSLNLIDTPLDVRVVIGASNPHYLSIKEESDRSRHNIETVRNIEDMASLMAWADVSFSAGGTTIWELAFMRLPSLLCVVAENQAAAVSNLEREGAFGSLGWFRDRSEEYIRERIDELINDKETRVAMVEKLKAVVDGRGVQRVVGNMVGFSSLPVLLRNDFDFGDVKFISFVNLTQREGEMVLKWRNKEEIRKWMFTDHIISKEEHLRFIEKLRNDDSKYYWMVKVNDEASGVGSFQNVDIDKGCGSLGIYSVKKGSGKHIMQYLLHLWFGVVKMRMLRAEFIEGNERAFALYSESGFIEEGVVHSVQKEGKSFAVKSMLKVSE